MIKLSKDYIKEKTSQGKGIFVIIHKETKTITNLVELLGLRFVSSCYYWQAAGLARDKFDTFDFDVFDYFIFNNMQEFCTWYLEKQSNYEFFDKSTYVDQWKDEITNTLEDKTWIQEKCGTNTPPLAPPKKPSTGYLKINEGYEKKGGINPPPQTERPDYPLCFSGTKKSKANGEIYINIMNLVDMKFRIYQCKKDLELVSPTSSEHTRLREKLNDAIVRYTEQINKYIEDYDG